MPTATGPRRSPEGIALRHNSRCATRGKGPCDCRPSYQAQVYSPRDRKTIRKTFRSLSDARVWRSEAQTGLNRGTLRAPTRGEGHGGVLNRIYSVEDDRSLKRELLTSVVVGAAVALLVVLALATVRLGPLAFTAVLGETTLVDILSFAVRWIVAIAALFLALGLIVRTAPATERPLRWITFGSLVVIGGWVAMTVLFGVYLTSIASFDSVFGGLASVFLLAEYLFLSAVFLLGGLLLDVVVEHRVG